MRIVATIFLAILPVLCAWPEETARIYVYADRGTAARSWRTISCDDTPVAKLKQGRFFVVSVAPGRHVLSDSKGVPASVEVRAGEEAFVSLEWNFHAGEQTVPVLHSVRPQRAALDMNYLVYIDADKVLSSSVAKSDPRPPRALRFKNRDEGK